MSMQLDTFGIFGELFKKGFFNEINSVMELGSQQVFCLGYHGGNTVNFTIHTQNTGADDNFRIELTGNITGSDKFSLGDGLIHDSHFSFTLPNNGRDPLHHQTYSTENEVITKFLKTIGRDKKTSIKNGDSAKIVYELLGVKEYECIDTNEKFGAHIFDLGENLVKKYNYNKKFDLVTNLGTSEHIFNQYNCFMNIHNLTKVGGYMFHVVPCMGYFNQSFYSYHPIFFEDLAKNNNYKMEGMWLWDAYRGGYAVPYSEENVKKCWGKPKVVIICLFKKRTEIKFKSMFQSVYFPQKHVFDQLKK